MTNGPKRRTVRKIGDLVAEDEAGPEELASETTRHAGKAKMSDEVGERREISKSPRPSDDH
jgi:hypothetical protein